MWEAYAPARDSRPGILPAVSLGIGFTIWIIPDRRNIEKHIAAGNPVHA